MTEPQPLPTGGLARILPARFLNNPLIRRVIRNSGYILGSNTLAAGLSFFQTLLSARLLHVAGYGLLGTITVFASNLNRLTSFRMGELVISYVGRYSAAGDHDRAAAVFKAAGMTEIGSSLVAYALVLALAPLGARYIAHDPATAPLFALYGLVLLANLMAESSTALLQFFNQYRLIAIFTVGQGAVTLAMIASAYILHGNLTTIVLAYLIGKASWALAITAAALVRAGREWGGRWWRTPLSLLDGRWRELTKFAVSTNVTATLNLVTRDSDLLWIGLLSSPLQVGYYKAARTFINILIVPVDPLINTTYREVAREVAVRQWNNVRYLLRSGSLIAATWTLPATLFLVIFGPWVLRLYGPEFAPAYGPLLVLLAGVLVVNIFYWNRNVLLPLGMPDFPTKVYLVAAALEVAGIVYFIPRLGAIGMALMLASFFVGTAVVLVWKSLLELKRAALVLPTGGG